MKKNKAGFTLIELLVAMTIMAVLMGISLVSYQGSKKSARDGKRKADMEQIRSALEIYRTDCKTYPASLTWGSTLTGTGTTGTSCLTTDTYSEEIPSDPGSCSYYYLRSTANSYVLCTSLETGGTVIDSHCGAATCGTDCTCNYGVANP